MAMFDEYLPPTSSPAPLSGDYGGFTPAPAPSPMTPDPGVVSHNQGHGGGMERFSQIMQAVLPALASVAAYRHGSLGSLTNGMMQVREAQHREALDKQEQQYRHDTQERLTRAEQRAEDEMRRRAEEDVAKQKQASEDRMVKRIETALAPFEGNPMYADGISGDVAAGAVITVPGVGRISLKDAFDRVGVMQDDQGNYHYGKYTKKETPPHVPLVTGEDGKRTEDKPGVKVHVPAPPKPDKPTRRSYTWRDDDPSSDTFGQSFRITEDENGNVINKQRLTGGGMAASGPITKTDVPGANVSGRPKVTIKSITPLP